jgi:hypothetical protein
MFFTHQQTVGYSSRTPFPHSLPSAFSDEVCGAAVAGDSSIVVSNKEAREVVFKEATVLFELVVSCLICATVLAAVVKRPAVVEVAAERQLGVQQKPHRLHSASFPGSSNGESAVNTLGQPKHDVAPTLAVADCPGEHAIHAVAPLKAENVPVGHSVQGDQPPLMLPIDPPGSARPKDPALQLRPWFPETYCKESAGTLLSRVKVGFSPPSVKVNWASTAPPGGTSPGTTGDVLLRKKAARYRPSPAEGIWKVMLPSGMGSGPSPAKVPSMSPALSACPKTISSGYKAASYARMRKQSEEIIDVERREDVYG